jgi:hypothetical protein
MYLVAAHVTLTKHPVCTLEKALVGERIYNLLI